MIKHAEIYKTKFDNEIRYIAKMYVTYRDERIRYNKLFWYDRNGGITKKWNYC